MLKRVVPSRWLHAWRASRATSAAQAALADHGHHQNLAPYWEPDIALALESWGEGNAWHEIRLLLQNAEGCVLDIACGTGKVISTLDSISAIRVHGCDISDFLLEKALARGIDQHRLTCCDATRLPFADAAFDYAYSIGSLEHFTEQGIDDFLSQCRRVVKRRSFHMIPVSRSGLDEGWLTNSQSYFNNSTAWWLQKASTIFSKVEAVDSVWQDEISVGKWLICED